MVLDWKMQYELNNFLNPPNQKTPSYPLKKPKRNDVREQRAHLVPGSWLLNPSTPPEKTWAPRGDPDSQLERKEKVGLKVRRAWQ